MLTSVHIRNVRSIADSGSLALGPVTLLVGRNNSGKSTVLRSLYLIQDGSPFETDDIRLRADGTSVSYDVTPRSLLAQRAHPDPSVNQQTDFKIEMTATRADPNPAFRSTWNAGQAANNRPRLAATRPDHIVVPIFAKRRADIYESTVREDLANGVGMSDRYLASRIAALTGDHPEAERFRSLLERVVGLRIGNHLTGQGQLPGRSLSSYEHISLGRMGDGVAAVMAIVAELAAGAPRLFLVEEPETDLHPAALQSLLDVMVEAVDLGSQFVVSTHNDLVLRQLGSVPGATVYRTQQADEDGLPTTRFVPVQDAFGRVEALRDLGYDARLPAAWIVFEESSAEQVVRDALIPLFFPRLGAVATVSARGASNLKVTVQDLVRLVLFVHLQGQEAADRTWILADGDEAGLDGLRAVGDTYPGIASDHLVPLSEFGFEDYYPPDFEAEVAAIRRMEDKRARKQAKGDLARRVTEWALADPDRAREQLQDSAAPVLAVLASIEIALAGDR